MKVLILLSRTKVIVLIHADPHCNLTINAPNMNEVISFVIVCQVEDRWTRDESRSNHGNLCTYIGSFTLESTRALSNVFFTKS